MSIFAGVPLWLWGFTFSVCLQALIKRYFGTKWTCVNVCWSACCACMCVFGPACVWLPGLKAVVAKPIHYASLYAEKGLFSLWVNEGKHLHCRLCESSISNYKTRIISSTNFTFQLWNSSHLNFLFLLYFLSLWLCLYFSTFLPSSVFAFSCCGVFSCFAGPTARVSKLSTPKCSTTSWKQQAVRMTSSCHKVFYVSLWVLTLSILLSTTASQHSLFCDIMFKQRKEQKNKKDLGINVWWFIDTKTRTA